MMTVFGSVSTGRAEAETVARYVAYGSGAVRQIRRLHSGRPGAVLQNTL